MQRAKAVQGNQHLAMMKRLDLTDKQKEQVQEIHLNGQQAMLPIRNQLREEMARLRTLTTSENYDQDAVQKTIQTIADLRADMMLEQVSHHQEVRSVLTEEQRIKFDTFQHKKHNAQLRQGFRGR
jgi:Spy/CpxP family protein refolding chaperone